MVIIKTSMGDIEVELNPQRAPVTVRNFLQYVTDEFFDGTIFHRVIGNFMIQGGGMTEDLQKKETRAPIQLEADNGLHNVRGTIAMARTGIPNSATSQFFISVADNTRSLDPNPRSAGYAVFGKVVSGMDVVDKIKAVKTHTVQRPGQLPMKDVPVETVTIISIRETK